MWLVLILCIEFDVAIRDSGKDTMSAYLHRQSNLLNKTVYVRAVEFCSLVLVLVPITSLLMPATI